MRNEKGRFFSSATESVVSLDLTKVEKSVLIPDALKTSS